MGPANIVHPVIFGDAEMQKSLVTYWLNKAAFTESPYLRICAKKYGYAYKKYAFTYKILTLVGLFYIAFYRTCVYTHAFFFTLDKEWIRTRYAYFLGIYKDIYLECDVTRLVSVVIMLLANKTLNVGSVLAKSKFFFYTNIIDFFLQLFLGSFVSIFTITKWCQFLLSIGGDNLQFYPNFALFLTLGGMNLDHDFVQVSKLSEDPKKRSSPKMEHFFSPNSGEDQKKKDLHQKRNTFFPRIQADTYAQMHTRVKLFGRMQMYSIPYSTQTIGGIQPNYWGDISPPPGFWHHVGNERLLVAYC